MYGLVKLAEDNKKREMTSGQHTGLGVLATGYGGSALVKAPKFYQEGAMERFYHGTSPEKAHSIREHGLLASKAGSGIASKGSDLAGRIGEDNVKGKVYITRNPEIAERYGRNEVSKGPFDFLSRGELVHFQIPKRHLDKGVLKEVANPELEGMTPEEKVDKLFADEEIRKYIDQLGKTKEELLDHWRGYDAPTTVTIEGNVPTRYIEGAKDFKKANLADITHAIMKHPKQMGPALGLTGLGLAGLGLGANQFVRAAHGEKEQE